MQMHLRTGQWDRAGIPQIENNLACTTQTDAAGSTWDGGSAANSFLVDWTGLAPGAPPSANMPRNGKVKRLHEP